MQLYPYTYIYIGMYFTSIHECFAHISEHIFCGFIYALFVFSSMKDGEPPWCCVTAVQNNFQASRALHRVNAFLFAIRQSESSSILFGHGILSAVTLLKCIYRVPSLCLSFFCLGTYFVVGQAEQRRGLQLLLLIYCKID